MQFKFLKPLLKPAKTWHNRLAWLAFISLFIWALSGLLHPLMSWTGPKLAAFFPPKAVLPASLVSQVPAVLKQHQINQALLVKVVPSVNGAVLQVTQDELAPRRYFDLSNYRELADHDVEHAKWLARHYTGLADTAIKSVTLQTQFDHAYPWVNRLLPVYKVAFDSPDGLTIYVHTETNAQAGLTNDYKIQVQGWFRTLHTWHWLDDFEYARVLLVGLLMLVLVLSTLTGMALVLSIKRSAKATWQRNVHHLVAYAIWLPLLGFSGSGLYHLLHAAIADQHNGLRLAQPLTWQDDELNQQIWSSKELGFMLNGLSLIRDPQGQLIYRLSLPSNKAGKGGHVHDAVKTAGKDEHRHHGHQAPQRDAIYDGIAITDPALYISAKTGQQVAFNDEKLVIAMAEQQLGLSLEQLQGTQLITHFGLHYDFRNKRLPVWQLDYDSKLGDKVFIDPATGILVDRLTDNARYEGYSFSFLHKWNFTRPFMERTTRDVIMSLVLGLAMLFAGLGIVLKIRRKAS
ncbi:PepSY domain-containing protein [Motilimonas sp. E26]|uniref:PepSY domain-containing protein n=1 Tax=Motilimonas sp. E26 TaxID=2865674 RepID=UPI001E603F3E|nr:PepSY domain-containing protein [Motilimonas sp. E26]MCE0555687.1 PepSY domain-containing protein [Motilimonas sp. E26]